MESTHSRNAGIAKFVNECLYDTKNPAQLLNSNIRNTINGFPAVMYINDELQGIYNFNLDRYSTKSFDEDKVLVYEISANSDTTAGAFYSWTEASGKNESAYYQSDFECLYPPTRAAGNDSLTELKRLIEWVDKSSLDSFTVCTEQELTERNRVVLEDIEELDAESKKQAYEHYTLIAGVLPFLTDVNLRGEIIKRLANEHNLSAQTIRNYLYEYLIYQNTAVLAPKAKNQEKKLTPEQKNIRWALNKFFYTKHNNSLNTAYTLMLKHKYCDENGVLIDKFPTFAQFRYFSSLNLSYISRKPWKAAQEPSLSSQVASRVPPQ